MDVRGIQARGDQLIAVRNPAIETQTIAPVGIRREPRILPFTTSTPDDRVDEVDENASRTSGPT